MYIGKVAQLLANIPTKHSILLIGATGIGKSQVARAIAKEEGKVYIDVRLPTMTEGDITGFPDIEAMKENGVMTFCQPAWFRRACEEPCVLNFEELNRALVSVQQSAFQIVLDREMGNNKDGIPYKLHPETRVIACINAGDAYQVNDMDPALLRRFFVINAETSPREWSKGYAKDTGISPVIRWFVETNQNHFRVDPVYGSGKVLPNPASWDRADEALKFAGIDLEQVVTGEAELSPLLYSILEGYVGLEASAAAVEFMKNHQGSIAPEKIFKDYDAIREVAESLTSSRMTSLVERCAEYLFLRCKESVKEEDEAKAKALRITADEAENFKKFFITLSGEVQNEFVRQLIVMANEEYDSGLAFLQDITKSIGKQHEDDEDFPLFHVATKIAAAYQADMKS